MPAYVFIPGFGNSLGEHWQNQWFLKLPNSHWLKQANWIEPECDVWVDCLQACIETIDEPIVFITHSLGGLTLVEWANRYFSNSKAKIVGAFMVAVPDPLKTNVPASIRGYTHYSLEKLPFPSKMVASTNDPYCNVNRTQFFSKNWGCELEFIGEKGHINTATGFGEWSEGLNMLLAWEKTIS